MFLFAVALDGEKDWRMIRCQTLKDFNGVTLMDGMVAVQWWVEKECV